MIRRIALTSILVLIVTTAASAQEDTCPEQVEEILSAVQDGCAVLGRNEVCYGHHRVDADTTETASFSHAGDIISVSTLTALRTYPLSVENEEWGVAVFSVQASIPDSIPGQNVTLIVFGEAQVQPDDSAPEDFQMPMQAFYLRTGIGQPACRAVPEGGVLVQNPRGLSVNLMINGFALRVGSTALFTAAETDELTVATLEGNVRVIVDGVEQDVPAGFTLTVTQDVPPALPELEAELEILPADLLPEAVPQTGQPAGEAIGLLICATGNGVDVAAGQDILLRGGWAEYELADVIAFMVGSPPTLTFDGQDVSYSFRAGPDPWVDQQTGADGFVVNWYWGIEAVAPGTHQAAWFVGGETFVCEVRAR